MAGWGQEMDLVGGSLNKELQRLRNDRTKVELTDSQYIFD